MLEQADALRPAAREAVREGACSRARVDAAVSAWWVGRMQTQGVLRGPVPSTRSASFLAAAGGPVRWPEVLRVLSSAELRQRAIDRYRAAGFTPDDFEHRPARWAMADALTRAEDWLEVDVIQSPTVQRQRKAVQAVRRLLEYELWP